MDILQNRRVWSGAGLALLFSLLVAWMTPPTEPRPPAPNWRANIKPVPPPAPVDFAGYAPGMAAMPAYPVERYAYATDETEGGEQVAIYRGSTDDDVVLPIATVSNEPADIVDASTTYDHSVPDGDIGSGDRPALPLDDNWPN